MRGQTRCQRRHVLEKQEKVEWSKDLPPGGEAQPRGLDVSDRQEFFGAGPRAGTLEAGLGADILA